jgi:ribosome-binding protein aMBF1 (putative translation factor)
MTRTLSNCQICGEPFEVFDNCNEYVCEDCTFDESNPIGKKKRKSKKDKGGFGMLKREQNTDHAHKAEYAQREGKGAPDRE